VNDAHRMKNWAAQQGFDESLTLTDDEPIKPVRENMRLAMKWLVDAAGPSDSLFLHYSGHGSTTNNSPSRYKPGADADDTIVPLDWAEAGEIVDNDLYKWLVEPLKQSTARLTVVFDCCHSGSGLDLHSNYRVNRDNSDVVRLIPNARPKLNQTADVVLLSACDDNQVAMDESDGVDSYGVLCHALLLQHHTKPDSSYRTMMLQIQRHLFEDPEMTQRPQLSAEGNLNLEAPFSVINDGVSRFLSEESG
jgi:hypothetical protein